MARAKRVILDSTIEAMNPNLRDMFEALENSTSKREREQTRTLRLGLMDQVLDVSILWNKYKELSSSDWNERKYVFQSCVETVLESNPIVGVVGKKEIVLAVEKNSTGSGLAKNILSLKKTTATLAVAGKEEDAPFLAKRVQFEIEEEMRRRGTLIPMSPEYVALDVAKVQKQLRHYWQIPYALFTLIVGFDPFTWQPGLFAADPGGRVGQFAAYAIGRDLELRNEFLRNNYQEETSGETAVELAIRALLEVGEVAKKNIEVSMITSTDGLEQLEQAKIDAICAEIETKKAASKAPTHKRTVEKGRKKAEKAAARKERRKAKEAAAQAAKKALRVPDEPSIDVTVSDKMDLPEEQVDEIEIREEKAASDKMDLPEEQVDEIEIREENAAFETTYQKKKKKKEKKAAFETIYFGEFGLRRELGEFGAKQGLSKKKRRKAKKAAAQAATKALPDKPSIDVPVSDKMDLPEEQVDEIEIREEKAAFETICFGTDGVMRRDLEKMGAEKVAAEAAPLVDVAVADQMALPEEPQVDEIEIREEKAAYEEAAAEAAKKSRLDKLLVDVEAAKKARLGKVLVDIADLMALLEKPQVDEIKIGKEKAGYETLRYIMPMPFRRLMSKVEKMRAEKAAAEGAKKAP